MIFRLFRLPSPLRAGTPNRTPSIPVPLADAAQLSEDALLARLGSHREGLTNHEAALLYRRVGANSIADERPPPAWREFAGFIANPLSLLLLTLAAVSFFTGGREDAAVIMAMVLLSAGNLVPGDLRILDARDLFVSQSALTGESLPVEKRAGFAAGGSPLESPNLALMGSYVISGTATAVVLATGAATHFGAIARATGARREPTGFDLGVNRYLWLLLRFMLVMVPAVFLINGVTKGNWMDAFVFALAVAVGLTPEMLPMVITANLAKGALAMAGKRVIVKRLAAIQNFGAMDVLATDKTGTLTQDKVLLERHVDIFGTESRRVLEFACLNSFFQSGLRNLLDEAVLAHAELHEHIKSGAGYRKVDEIPFDFQRRRMSVVVESSDGERHLLICKGAVDEVFAVCGCGSCATPASRSRSSPATTRRSRGTCAGRSASRSTRRWSAATSTRCRTPTSPRASGRRRCSRGSTRSRRPGWSARCAPRATSSATSATASTTARR